MAAIDITGKRYGKLVALRQAGVDATRHMRWVCRCDCGKEHTAVGSELRKGDVKSCGCSSGALIAENQTSHGKAVRGKVSGIYRSWADARYRCNNPNAQRYNSYGGRGIKVCERWDSFENFLEDMGPTWEPGMTLDRMDNDGDYEPGNCQWLTLSENSSKGNRHTGV